MRSARAARLLRELSVVSDELLMLELLPDVEGEALESVLEEVEPEVEPEAPMLEELLLGVLDELALGVVVVVVVVVLPEAPIVLDDLSVLLDDDGMLEDEEPVFALALSTLGDGLCEVPGLLESPLEVPTPELLLPEVWAAA